MLEGNQCKSWSKNVGEIGYRYQFNQHFSSIFKKCYSPLFFAHSLCLYFFGKRVMTKMQLIKCWWNWLLQQVHVCERDIFFRASSDRLFFATPPLPCMTIRGFPPFFLLSDDHETQTTFMNILFSHTHEKGLCIKSLKNKTLLHK